MLILAYADWCGHCQAFKPEWDKFKQKYGAVLDIRELNADKTDKKILEQLGVQGYPTVIILHNGKKIVYKGERNMTGLEKFVKETVNHHTKDELSAFRNL